MIICLCVYLFMCLFVYLFICLFAYICNHMCVCMVSARCNFMLVTRLPSVKSNVASWRIPQLGDSSKEKRPGWVPTGYPDDVPPKKNQSNMANAQSPKKSLMVYDGFPFKYVESPFIIFMGNLPLPCVIACWITRDRRGLVGRWVPTLLKDPQGLSPMSPSHHGF